MHSPPAHIFDIRSSPGKSQKPASCLARNDRLQSFAKQFRPLRYPGVLVRSLQQVVIEGY